jgi:hypothetical protein
VPGDELQTVDTGVRGTGLGCLSGIILLSGILHLWVEYDFWFSTTEANVPLTGWQVFSHVLWVAVGVLSLQVTFWLWWGQPYGWRRAFLSLRALLYSYLLLAYYALHRAAVLDAQGRDSWIYGLSFLVWAGLAFFTFIGIAGMLQPSVLAAYGVSPPERKRRCWWRLTWWP